MTVAEIVQKSGKMSDRRDAVPSREPASSGPVRPRVRVFPVLITLATVVLAAFFGWAMWDAYMGAPWTRDATVRAYVVTLAPEVAGRIVEFHVADNQLVHKGDLLMVIDPTDFRIAVSLAEAAVTQAAANAQNAREQAERRRKLTDVAASVEEKQTFNATALSTEAQTQQAQANLEKARVDLERTQIRSPVDGYVTNLQAQLGDYVSVGQNQISIVDANSFWIDGYFEETKLERIRVDDPVSIKLMGCSEVIQGHVDSVARGINVPNAQPDGQGLANVNPIFTWVRLAQRIPVRVHIDKVPSDVILTAGMTATIEVNHRVHAPSPDMPR